MILPRFLDHWPEYWRELYKERAGIKQFSGNLEKFQAESEAEQEIRKMAEGSRQESLKL